MDRAILALNNTNIYNFSLYRLFARTDDTPHGCSLARNPKFQSMLAKGRSTNINLCNSGNKRFINIVSKGPLSLDLDFKFLFVYSRQPRLSVF